MKREFLEGLGLDKDTVDAVMSEYGRGIGEMKAKCAGTDAECVSLRDGISKLEKRAAELEKGLSASERKYHDFLDAMIRRIADDAGFSSLSARNTAIQVMQEEAAHGNDLFTVIDGLRDADPGAFAADISGKPHFSAPPSPAPVMTAEPGNGFTRRRF